MSADQVSPSQEAIENGRRCYAAKRYKSALEHFTRAMKACPCARGLKRERCGCKDYESTAAKDSSIFKEAMYNCRCSVGKTFNKCENDTHIQALDYRAATFETLQELDRARRDAEWILELSPRRPDGYLRLGKIARLQKKYEYAWKIYTAGIEAARGGSAFDSSKLKQLYNAREPLHKRFCRKDPIHLPMEIIQTIFSYIELGTLTQCIRVSRVWKNTLTARGNERLWRSLLFTKSQLRRPPRLDSLRKLLLRSRNDARHILIEDGRRFCLSQPKLLALLNGAKNLERLELAFPFEPVTLPKLPGRYQSLKHIELDGFESTEYWGDGNQGRVGTPNYFVEHVVDVLEHLRLTGIFLHWLDSTTLPKMPKLKTLRLEQKTTRGQLSILHLAAQTPQLEQLWLENVKINTLGDWKDKWSQLWNGLKVLVVMGNNVLNSESSSALTLISLVNQGRTLEHIDLSIHWQQDNGSILNKGFLGILEHNPELSALELRHDYKNLRSLRLGKTTLNPSSAQLLFENSLIRYKTLHTFDIVFPLESFDRPMGEISSNYLKSYSWVRGAESIRCVGLFGFRFRSYPSDDDDLPLPAFLATLPNLETLEISSEHYEDAEFCTVVEAILKMTKLRTIYQDRVKGAMMDQLRVLTENRGVNLVWGQRHRSWPQSFE